MNDGFGYLSDDRPRPMPATRWIAVSTHPHRAQVAIENLVRQKFSLYCPMELKRIRHARRIQNVARPLFPSYIFAEVALDLSLWRPILSTYGVRTVLRFGDRPAFVDDAFIQGLRAREIDGIIAQPTTPYRVGQQVQLSGGPFDGLIATIVEMDVKDRLVLLTSLLNQNVRLKVTSANVRAF